jgi:phospholipase/carboxylesterase
MSYTQTELSDCIVLTPERRTPSASVIWLHGLGADGHDFVPIVPELRLTAAEAPRFVFPHAPVRAVTINNGMHMRAWYDIFEFSPSAREDAAGIRASAEIVEGYVQRERDAGVACERIVLAGFSQGGAIALHAGLHHPERLAGIMALSAYLPLRAELEAPVPTNRGLPILMCHGEQDPVLPVALAELSRDLLQAQGYQVELKLYRMQHQVIQTEITDIAAWLRAVLPER